MFSSSIDLFPELKVPYFVWGPPWTHESSGVRTLHLLVHALNSVGQRAYLVPVNTVYYTNPALDTPVLNDEHAAYYTLHGIDPIVVYPDIVAGNPFNGKKVVRYLLAPRGAYGGDKEFSVTDKVYGYTKALAEDVLCIPTFDQRIFHSPPYETKREGACYYAHKYDKIHGNALLPITDGATRLVGEPEKLADILRKSSVCYVYEHSEIIINAALCGCPVVLVRTPYFNELPKDGFKFYGVRWSDQPVLVEEPLITPCLATRRMIDRLDRELHDQLAEFVRDTQGRWE